MLDNNEKLDKWEKLDNNEKLDKCKKLGKCEKLDNNEKLDKCGKLDNNKKPKPHLSILFENILLFDDCQKVLLACLTFHSLHFIQVNNSKSVHPPISNITVTYKHCRMLKFIPCFDSNEYSNYQALIFSLTTGPQISHYKKTLTSCNLNIGLSISCILAM
jgi:hypothetical protein